MLCIFTDHKNETNPMYVCTLLKGISLKCDEHKSSHSLNECLWMQIISLLIRDDTTDHTQRKKNRWNLAYVELPAGRGWLTCLSSKIYIRVNNLPVNISSHYFSCTVLENKTKITICFHSWYHDHLYYYDLLNM